MTGEVDDSAPAVAEVRRVFGPDIEVVDAEEAWPGEERPRFRPLDLRRLEAIAGSLAEVEWLLKPHLPKGARVWAWGPAESGKSIWALDQCAKLSREGQRVAYFSQENPRSEDNRRLARLRPHPDRLLFFRAEDLDLAQPDDVRALVGAVKDCELVVFDTLTACWSGDENDNAAIAALDREALLPIVSDTGATVLLLHHTGHPQAHVTRRGASAGRGASSMGQKADVVLEFRSKGEFEFEVAMGKNRVGGKKAPPILYRVEDTDDGGLAVVRAGLSADRQVKELADEMVEAIASAGALTTKQLRDSVGGGRERADQAFRLLEAEDPPRVSATEERVATAGGRQRAKVWRVCEG